MNLEKIRELLPKKSYERIADELCLSKGTVAQWFVGQARVSDDTAHSIVAKAIQIIRERKEDSEAVIAEYKAAERAVA